MPNNAVGVAEEPRAVDAIVVGAGFAGIYLGHRLLELGLTVQGFEKGADVGGTWYWNRYPGARVDSENTVYSYGFSEELDQEWDWTERFPEQHETLKYLGYVADKFKVRQSFAFSTTVTSATFDEQAHRWTVTTDRGETWVAKYFVSCVGILSDPITPDIAGLDTFAGQVVHTSDWPHEGLDLSGKRVALIGVGSTGVQLIPELAKHVAHLTVFQRTPNYVVPVRHVRYGEAERDVYRQTVRGIRDESRRHPLTLPYKFSGRKVFDHTPQEREEIFEAAWNRGGFCFMVEAFDDIMLTKEANDTASDFLRGKIRQIVKDPVVADRMTPSYPYGVKRPPSGAEEFYAAFNLEHVELVDIRETPITEITEGSIRTSDAEFDADVLILATGFNAVTGAIEGLNVTGRNGLSLRDRWADGPVTTFGMMVSEFPNMFMVGGPHFVSAIWPAVVEISGDWIYGVIRHAEAEGIEAIEPTSEAQRRWMEHLDEVNEGSLLAEYGEEANSYTLGANIEGKARAILYYFGGADVYQELLAEQARTGYPALRQLVASDSAS